MRSEACLDSPSSLPSNTGTSASRLPRSTSRWPARTDITGSAIVRAACQVTNSPTLSDTPPSATALAASSSLPTFRPASSEMATNTRPSSGTALPSAQASSARVVTPG